MRMTEYERHKERLDLANLVVSTASLGLAAAALCLNEKPIRRGDDRMASRVEPGRYGTRKDLKKAYRAEIKKAAVTEIGYTGPVIVLNEGGRDVRYGIVPLDVKPERKRATPKSWVAMEMNARTGGDRQAVVCGSRAEAEKRASAMKRAHKKGSAKERDCVQGYARIDVSEPIDVREWLGGGRGTVYGVRAWRSSP